MQSSVENWICLLGPEVSGKIMLGQICAENQPRKYS